MIERLKQEGCEGERAESIAMGIISLLEGSFVLALTYRNTEPLINAAKIIPKLTSEAN
ncbi:hypothetical protein D3C71_1919180 [compost metagenome]